MRRALWVVWFLGAGCGQLGGTVCPLQIQSTFRVDFDPPFSTPGSYDVNLTLDGEAATCRAELPGLASFYACPPLSPQVVQANGKLTAITFWSAPQKVDVKVVMNGTQVGAGTFTPNFSKPNACGQVSAPAAKLTH